MGVADRLHLGPHLLARQARAQLADQPRADRHRLVGRPLRAADALDLGLGLHAPLVHERLGVDDELDAGGAQMVGDAERELGRHERALHAEPLARAPRELELELVERDAAARAARRRRGRRGRRSRSRMGTSLSASSTDTVAARRPSVSTYRKGSMIPVGTAWKRSGEESGAPKISNVSVMGSPSTVRAPPARTGRSGRNRTRRRGRAPRRAPARAMFAEACPCPTPPGRAAARAGRRRRAARPAPTSASRTRWENSAPLVSSRLAAIRSACTTIPRATRSARCCM